MNKVKQLSNGGLGRSSALVYSDVFCRWVKKPAQPSVLQQVFLPTTGTERWETKNSPNTWTYLSSL